MGGQINVKGRENPLTGVIKTGVVQYKINMRNRNNGGSDNS